MTTPEPTHLDQRDPAKAEVRDIREEVDREIEAYRGLEGLVLLVPEDRWDEFLRLSGCEADAGIARYKGATLHKGPVTAVVAEEGF